MNHKLTDIEFLKVCMVLASNLGLNFTADRRLDLNRNLANAAGDLGFGNLPEFISWLLSENRVKTEFETIANYFTNSETYFWRESAVFNAFTQNVLPELIESKKYNGKRINIWCAGCSTGEEAYSIAIALYRTIPDLKYWNVTILATDINETVLSKARKAVYGEWSFRNSPLWLRKRLENLSWEVIPEIRKMVTFSDFNITREDYLSVIFPKEKIDIVFCRNVIMYFTPEWAAKVSHNLSNSVADEGWLIVSSCELSSELFPALKPVNFPGAVLYRKAKNEFSHYDILLKPHHNNHLKSTLKSLVLPVVAANQLISVESTLITESINSEFKTEISTVAIAASADAAKTQPHPKRKENFINEKKHLIRLLADKGHLEEALTLCNKAIDEERLAPGLYYLRATILQEQNNNTEAIKSLKQAIYIDPNYIMGHFTLGNIFSRQGVWKNAKQYFRNALELLNSISNDEIPSESEGLSANYIRGIILSSLQTQEAK
jgi:chemotaxis protein methyltransferase CheR